VLGLNSCGKGTGIDDLFVPDKVFPADIAIVFGITSWQRPVLRAIELYRGGMAQKLLFTGGFNERIHAVEATEMANAAIDAGICSSDILVEPEATNTVENVANAYRCIDQSIGMGKLRSLLLIAIHFHMRRVKVIVERTFPRRIDVGYASYPSVHYNSLNWFQSARGREDVRSEAKKIEDYLRAR
jgi:uncharacterized SAM-binding protein YcdF (DUF218 family)